jgi:hypothetical protein
MLVIGGTSCGAAKGRHGTAPQVANHHHPFILQVETKRMTFISTALYTTCTH